MRISASAAWVDERGMGPWLGDAIPIMLNVQRKHILIVRACVFPSPDTKSW